MKDQIKQLLSDFYKNELPKIINRDLEVDLESGQIVSILGSRRSGKTYFLYQIIQEILHKGVLKEQIVFINFEDERLVDIDVKNLDEILQGYLELYPNQDLSEVYFFFDEIQNVDKWEMFVRRIHETISKNVYVTGSNSRFLTTEIATNLRGRTLSYEIFPLSFSEFLKFKGFSFDHSTKSNALVNNYLSEYFEFGGFPDVVKNQNQSTKIQILQSYFDSMIFNDLVQRYDIKNVKALQFFIKQLIASHTKEFSVNKIYNTLKSMGLGISKDLTYDYLEYCQNIYLGSVLFKYDLSQKAREINDKKFYTIDNGLYNSLIFKTDLDLGKQLEHLVFSHFFKKTKEIFFYKDSTSECDFLIFNRGNLSEIIQVCTNLNDLDTRNREINGLLKACMFFGKKSGKIITLNTKETIEIDGITVEIIPILKFLSVI